MNNQKERKILKQKKEIKIFNFYYFHKSFIQILFIIDTFLFLLILSLVFIFILQIIISY